jgi:hypothetical protein
MDTISVSNVLKIASDFGLVGLILFLWWTDGRRIMVVLDQNKKDLAEVLERDAHNLANVLERYQRDMTEQREMYRNNASLCRDFASIATDLRDIVTLNIQSMTQVNESVKGNQFCPMMRIREDRAISQFHRDAEKMEANKWEKKDLNI